MRPLTQQSRVRTPRSGGPGSFVRDVLGSVIATGIATVAFTNIEGPSPPAGPPATAVGKTGDRIDAAKGAGPASDGAAQRPPVIPASVTQPPSRPAAPGHAPAAPPASANEHPRARTKTETAKLVAKPVEIPATPRP